MKRFPGLRAPLLACAVLLAPVQPTFPASLYSWQNVTPQAAYAGRDGAGVVVYNNKAWLLGGWNSLTTVFPYTTTNEVWNSSDGHHWSLVKPNTFVPGVFNPGTQWEGRHMAGWVVFQNKMWIVGGDSNQCHYQPNVWTSTDGVRWTKVADNVPWGNRVLHYTVVFNNQIWVMGGQTLTLDTCPGYTGNETYFNDVWESSDGITWAKAPQIGPRWAPRGMIAGSVVFNGRIWILGGGEYGTDVAYNDVWSSPDGVHWEQVLENAPWEPRVYHSVAVYGGRMWVVAGHQPNGGSNLAGVWSSADGVHWERVPHTPWLARHAASLFAINGGLWITGGTTNEDGSQDDVWKLDSGVVAPLIDSLLFNK